MMSRFWDNILDNPRRSSGIPEDKQTLMVYQEEQRKQWHHATSVPGQGTTYPKSVIFSWSQPKTAYCGNVVEKMTRRTKPWSVLSLPKKNKSLTIASFYLILHISVITTYHDLTHPPYDAPHRTYTHTAPHLYTHHTAPKHIPYRT